MAEVTATPRRTVLVVDDDDALRGSLRRHLRRAWNVVQATDCAEAFEALEQTDVDAVLVDIRLPDGLGFEVADRAARLDDRPGVIIMTGDGQIDDAIQALHHGAADFLLKPFSLVALDRALGRIFQAPPVSEPPSLRSLDHHTVAGWRDKHAPELMGNAPELLAAIDVVRKVADTDVSVLITGESGTGKELVARALHQGGGRRGKPFVTVNSAAIPDNLLESELFGHKKGAFTGAVSDRDGRFVAAHEGTLFLDEIGEMPLNLQAKILRALQEKTITPVGGHKAIPVDVRILAATNRDLEEMVESGRFREDLLYRLNVIPIHLPPLRDRPGDIKLLTEMFIDQANRRRSRSITGVRSDAMDLMSAYDWPGNVRQLENSIERMVVLRTEGELTPEDLPPRIRAAGARRAGPVTAPVLPEEGLDLRQAVEEFENALIVQALVRTANNKNKAAELLRMNRTTLVERIKKRRIVVG